MRILAVFLLLFCLYIPGFATWSIILVDPVTKKIGIAGASCTHNCFGIGKIVPGKGAIVVQAMSNKYARAKGAEMIKTGASPHEIIAALQDSIFDPQRQQYAIVSLAYLDAPITFTGEATHAGKGALTALGVSVQGNTLADEQALQAILAAVLQGQKDQLPLEEILMLALEAGAAAGGDKRCGEQKATSAFILVAKPDDKRPSVNMQFFGQKPGGMNAVSLLRGKYEKWKRKHAVS